MQSDWKIKRIFSDEDAGQEKEIFIRKNSFNTDKTHTKTYNKKIYMKRR